MSRRPSLLASSSSSTISTITLGNGHANGISSMSNGLSSHPRIISSTSLSKVSIHNNMDPDELFIKYNISEIKLIQQRLRADADAKQEELRLMVGERYRDLLQASTSIISIARSSCHVIEALTDTKSAILDEHPPSIPKHTSVKINEDVHLQALQILAAHIKLLLDVPEHLWRMLEKKKFFPAAWLYLLSRVVYRALVREDQDDEAWRNQGIDVLESFPLVQRQWEAVAQFRPQIIHKAALSMRDSSASSQEVCATLLTLHLLDSRPLSDTLAALLDQRSKSLQAIISKTPVPQGSIREIKKCILAALDSISRTIKTSRDVFEARDSELSLIRASLEFIQTDTVHPDLPSELQLTTQTLLNNLPSSSHFSTLPQVLRSYKPHVDVNHQFSSIPPAHLDQLVSDWFHKSADTLRTSCQTWLLQANTVKVIWSIRNFVRNWLHSFATLDFSETTRLKSLFDDVCRERIIEIWKAGLSNAELAFSNQLSSTVTSLKNNSEISMDASPIAHLFDAPSLPSATQLEDQPLQKYRTALQRQLLGRVSLLDNVLRTLEKCAATLQDDLLHVLRGDDAETVTLIAKLKESYQPHAQILCTAVLKDLEVSANALPDRNELDINALVFVGRVVEEISSSSTFLSNMCYDEAVTEEFQQKAKSLYNIIIDRWRQFTVLRVLSRHRIAVPVAGLKPLPCVSPSTNLIQSLLSLGDAIQDLGFSRDSSRHTHLVDQTLHLFICRLVNRQWERDEIQMLYDIAFLRKLADVWGTHWSDVCDLLDVKASQIRKSASAVINLPSDETLSSNNADYIAKTQTLLAAVLPYPNRHSLLKKSVSSDKFTVLLPLGVPSAEQEYRPAVEVAKQSSRFALLLL